jgi:hypothetical protein
MRVANDRRTGRLKSYELQKFKNLCGFPSVRICWVHRLHMLRQCSSYDGAGVHGRRQNRVEVEGEGVRIGGHVKGKLAAGASVLTSWVLKELRVGLTVFVGLDSGFFFAQPK